MAIYICIFFTHNKDVLSADSIEAEDATAAQAAAVLLCSKHPGAAVIDLWQNATRVLSVAVEPTRSAETGNVTWL